MAMGSFEFISEGDGTYWESAVAVASATALASNTCIRLITSGLDEEEEAMEVDVGGSAFPPFSEVPLAEVIFSIGGWCLKNNPKVTRS
jgi:hypothetical protein